MMKVTREGGLLKRLQDSCRLQQFLRRWVSSRRISRAADEVGPVDCAVSVVGYHVQGVAQRDLLGEWL